MSGKQHGRRSAETALTPPPVTFEDLERLSRSEVFSYDANIAIEIEKLFKRESWRNRLAAHLLARRRFEIVAAAGRRVENLEGMLFQEERMRHQKTETLVALYRVFSDRQLRAMAQIDGSEMPAALSSEDYRTAAGIRVEPPTTPIEDGTARRVLHAIEAVGSKVAERRLGRFPPPPIFVEPKPPRRRQRGAKSHKDAP